MISVSRCKKLSKEQTPFRLISRFSKSDTKIVPIYSITYWHVCTAIEIRFFVTIIWASSVISVFTVSLYAISRSVKTNEAIGGFDVALDDTVL